MTACQHLKKVWASWLSVSISHNQVTAQQMCASTRPQPTNLFVAHAVPLVQEAEAVLVSQQEDLIDSSRVRSRVRTNEGSKEMQGKGREGHGGMDTDIGKLHRDPKPLL